MWWALISLFLLSLTSPINAIINFIFNTCYECISFCAYCRLVQDFSAFSFLVKKTARKRKRNRLPFTRTLLLTYRYFFNSINGVPFFWIIYFEFLFSVTNVNSVWYIISTAGCSRVSASCRVAAKNCVFREIFLEFREISWNTKSNFRRNYRNFATHEIKIWETFLQKNMIFNRFLKIKNKIYIKSDHIVRSSNPNRFWPFFIWGKERVVFLTF